MPDKTRRHLAASKAALGRWHPNADTTQLDSDLREARVADYIRRTVDAAPPLSPEARDRLALLLRGGDAA